MKNVSIISNIFRISLCPDFNKCLLYLKLIPGSNEVEFLAEMFHPNIDKGQICIDQDDVRYTLDRTTIGILNTLHEPQYYDVSSLTFHQVCNGQSMARIYRTTRLALTGRPIGSLQCPRYIEDDEEILDFLREIESEKQRSLHARTTTVAHEGQCSPGTTTVAQEGQVIPGTTTAAQKWQHNPGPITVAEEGHLNQGTTTVAQKGQLSPGTTTVAQKGEPSLGITTVAQKGQRSPETTTVAQEGQLSNGATSDETHGRNVNKTG